MRLFHSSLLHWLPFACAITGMSLLVYVGVQHAGRTAANDPQIQMAEDAAALIDRGRAVADIVPLETVDLERSLAPFITIYDSAGKAVASSGLLRGQMPRVPKGVILFALENRRNRVTWQPQPGLRFATVLVRSNDNHVVLAGRSLRESDRRTGELARHVTAVWILSLLGTFVLCVGAQWFLRKRPR